MYLNSFPVPRVLSGPMRGLAGALLLLLCGCSANGDFGEIKPTLVRDDIHDWLGVKATTAAGGVPSNFEVTDDERLLRDLAFPLIQPPYDRQQWYSILAEYGVIGNPPDAPFDKTLYAAELMSTAYRSPSGRYSHLTEDIRNDITRLPQYFSTAGRVVDTDHKREQALRRIHASPQERADVARRVRENALIMRWVKKSLAQRAASYRFALERLVISTPGSMAAESEQVLGQLETGLAEAERLYPRRLAVISR